MISFGYSGLTYLALMQLVTTPLEQSAIMKEVYACAISGCRLPHKLESGHFTLVSLWCGRAGGQLDLPSSDYQNVFDG